MHVIMDNKQNQQLILQKKKPKNTVYYGGSSLLMIVFRIGGLYLQLTYDDSLEEFFLYRIFFPIP